jgi:hypothetical protein
MKDALPLGSDGWGVLVHQAECGEDPENPKCITGEWPCFATRVHFVGFPDANDDLALAVQDMSTVLNQLGARNAPVTKAPADVDAPGNLRWVAAASTIVRQGDEPGDVFGRTFDLITDAVAALRNATGAGIADPTIERMYWPVPPST